MARFLLTGLGCAFARTPQPTFRTRPDALHAVENLRLLCGKHNRRREVGWE